MGWGKNSERERYYCNKHWWATQKRLDDWLEKQYAKQWDWYPLVDNSPKKPKKYLHKQKQLGIL